MTHLHKISRIPHFHEAREWNIAKQNNRNMSVVQTARDYRYLNRRYRIINFLKFDFYERSEKHQLNENLPPSLLCIPHCKQISTDKINHTKDFCVFMCT